MTPLDAATLRASARVAIKGSTRSYDAGAKYARDIARGYGFKAASAQASYLSGSMGAEFIKGMTDTLLVLVQSC